MNRNVDVYVPEAFLTRFKHRQAPRVCQEDLIIADAANGYRVVAGRGEGVTVGEEITRLWQIPTEEVSFLEKTLPRKRRVVLWSDNGPILVLSDFLMASGALLFIRLHFAAALLPSVLRALGREELCLSPAFQRPCKSDEAHGEAARKILHEVMRYLDLIFDLTPTTGLAVTVIAIANFSGCLLDCLSLPEQSPCFTRTDRLRLIAFLFCVFLQKRSEQALPAVSLRVPFSDMPVVRCRMELTSSEPSPLPPSATPPLPPPLARLHGLRTFSFYREDGKTVVEAVLDGSPDWEPPCRYAAARSCVRFRMVLGE